MRGMFLFVRRSLPLLGVEKDRLDWGEHIALNVADVGRLVFVYRDGSKATTQDLDACMSLFTDTLSPSTSPTLFVGDFNWCLREPSPLPPAVAAAAFAGSRLPLASTSA